MSEMRDRTLQIRGSTTGIRPGADIKIYFFVFHADKRDLQIANKIKSLEHSNYN